MIGPVPEPGPPGLTARPKPANDTTSDDRPSALIGATPHGCTGQGHLGVTARQPGEYQSSRADGLPHGEIRLYVNAHMDENVSLYRLIGFVQLERFLAETGTTTSRERSARGSLQPQPSSWSRASEIPKW